MYYAYGIPDKHTEIVGLTLKLNIQQTTIATQLQKKKKKKRYPEVTFSSSVLGSYRQKSLAISVSMCGLDRVIALNDLFIAQQKVCF